VASRISIPARLPSLSKSAAMPSAVAVEVGGDAVA